MSEITVKTSLIPVSSDPPMTAGMSAILLEIGAVLDEERFLERLKRDDAPSFVVSIPAKRLRGGRGENNRHLREILRRLTRTTIEAEYLDGSWRASALIADALLPPGEETAEITLVRAAVTFITAPRTFTKLNRQALWAMKGPGRRLYAELANKKHLNRTEWVYSLDELREVFDRRGRYMDWRDFRKRLLLPAIDDINSHAPVTVTATPVRESRRIVAVRIAWAWKTPEEAHETAAEMDRHTTAQGRVQVADDAPPLLTAQAETWQTIRDLIVEGRGREARSWLQDIAVTGTDDRVVLHAPSSASADYVDRTYGALISRLWSRLDPAATIRIEAAP